MHSNAIGGLIEGSEERDDLVLAALPQAVKRPGTVLAAAPREQGGFHAINIEDGRNEKRVSRSSPVLKSITIKQQHALRGI